MMETELGGASPPALWDRVVRISHWGIAAVVFANELFTSGGSATHLWIGWIGLVLLVIRLVWGFVGTREARFSAFPPDPQAAIGHTKELFAGRPRHYGSHNPAGAMMVYALWAALAVVIATGLYLPGSNPLMQARQEAAVNSDDWSTLVAPDSAVPSSAVPDSAVPGSASAAAAPDVRSEADGTTNLVRQVHGAVANLILFLVSLHVAGAFIEGLVMRRNLLLPMVFGDRKSHKP